MSGAGTDLIAAYLAELRAGLWAPAAEAELIVAEAEDHLRETASVGMEIGMTEREAQEAAISSFGPVRAVVQAHRRRAVTAGHAAMAAWKLTGLLSATVGLGGLASVFLLHSSRALAAGVQVVPVSHQVCQCSINAGPIAGPVAISSLAGLAVRALPYAAVAAAGLTLLVTRRLALRGPRAWDPLSPAVTASFFLLVTALMLALNVSGAGSATLQVDNWNTPISTGSVTTTVPLIPGAIVAGCIAVAAGYSLQAALRRARRGPRSGALALPGRDRLSAAVTASFCLLVSALMFALDMSGVGGVTRQVTWISLPLSSGSVTTAAPLVPGAIVAVCVAAAVGYGLQTALRPGWRGPGSGAPALRRSGSG
jgi:uncharacterized membrane protein (DUF485 family)